MKRGPAASSTLRGVFGESNEPTGATPWAGTTQHLKQACKMRTICASDLLFPQYENLSLTHFNHENMYDMLV